MGSLFFIIFEIKRTMLKFFFPMLLQTATNILLEKKDKQLIKWLFSAKVSKAINDFIAVYNTMDRRFDGKD